MNFRAQPEADRRPLPNVNDALSSDKSQELKEAVCDALVNGIAAKVSGFGEFGEFVFGQRPRDQFTSALLLNQVSASGEDESSDIRIAVHGASLKLKEGIKGSLTIQPRFSAYVRVLPTWEELDNPILGLKPKPRLTRDAQREIRAEAKEKTNAAVKSGDKRHRNVIFEQNVREALQQRGARFRTPAASVVMVTAIEESSDDQGDEPSAQPASTRASKSNDQKVDQQLPLAVAETAEGAEYPDALCIQEEIPLKFRRLDIAVPSLSLLLSAGPAEREKALVDHAGSMCKAIETAYETYLLSMDGNNWAWRNVRLEPSAFRSRQAWEAALVRIRATPPRKERLWPEQQPELTLEWATNPTEPGIVHAAVGLLHRACSDTAETYGEGGLFQVGLSIDLTPADALIPYVLERIKPAYDIYGFHTIPAAGWNSGVTEERLDGTVRLNTTWCPRYVLPRIVPNQIQGLDLSFDSLADPQMDLSQLDLIPEEFEKWIEMQRVTIDPTAGIPEDDIDSRRRETDKFNRDLDAYRDEVEDLQVGIALLKESKVNWQADPGHAKAVPFRAWCLMNRAFLENGAREKKTTWRLFQIAFVIANIVSPATRMETFEHYYAPNEAAIELAALLYFATGGGKSEAFFGLLLFTLFLDRLRGKHRGISALIRYPLRLLTAQQARRLARILAKAEIIRRREEITGAPFEIGFWVGSGSTPNRIANGDKVLDEFKCIPSIDSDEHLNEEDNLADTAYSAARRDYNKLPNCPFCERETALRRYPNEHQRLGIVCLNESCEWNECTKARFERPLPFLLVDYDIYRVAPPVLLGTIDKLALIGQHWSTINRIAGMFGLAKLIDENGLLECPYDLDVERLAKGRRRIAPSFADGVEVFVDPVPSLIIQDEAHLLEESLGTFAGLFETTLYNWFRSMELLLGRRMARVPTAPTEIRLPKVITATATISDPQRQVRVLYQKQVRQFPHKGPRLYRSFYANPSQFEAEAAKRNGWLVASSNPKDLELYAPWARLYVSLLTNGRPHTTASVMILGAFIAITTYLIRNLCSGDPSRQTAACEFLRKNLSASPLTARHRQAIADLEQFGKYDVIAAAVDLHRVALTYVTNKKGGDQILSALSGIANRQHRDFGADAIVDEIRTELISGGVESGMVESIVRRAEKQFNPADGDVQTALRMIVATSAVSHGVDVENFNSMFFAGMPTAIDEFIQASSRVGRIHVGFSMLIPTPQNRRDRFILEVHEPFHRFLERMIAPPAIERWADRAILRIIPSLVQNWLIGKIYQEQFAGDEDPTKKRIRIFSKVTYVRSLVNRMRAMEFIDELERYILDCIGVDAIHGGAQSQRQTITMLVRERIREFVRLLEMPTADGDLGDFWEQFRANIDSPMTSLRDVDAPGTVRPYVAARKANAKERFATVMRFIREGGIAAAQDIVEVQSELRND